LKKKRKKRKREKKKKKDSGPGLNKSNIVMRDAWMRDA
jgi:hypothetical protein